MAGLLGYALAGGLTGYGNSLVEDAKAKREAAMEELRNSRLMEREDRDRSFRTSEREASQGFTARENAANRVQTDVGLSSNEKNVYTAIREANTSPDTTDELTGEKIPGTTNMGAVRQQLRSSQPNVYRKIFGEDAAPQAAPSISSDPIRLTSNSDPSTFVDKQIYESPTGKLGRWNAESGDFDPMGTAATARDAAGQTSSADPGSVQTPARSQPRSAGAEPTSPRNSDRPLTEVIRSGPGATFLRDNAVGPLSGPRSDNADAPEEKTQYGRDTALASQAVQSNRRDPQADRLTRQRAAVVEEIRKLDALLESEDITQPEYNRAMARFEADLARLDQEQAR